MSIRAPHRFWKVVDKPHIAKETVRRADADWKGKYEKRFIWRRWRFEWGRMCYRTDAGGNTLDSWWEAETPTAKLNGTSRRR